MLINIYAYYLEHRTLSLFRGLQIYSMKLGYHQKNMNSQCKEVSFQMGNINTLTLTVWAGHRLTMSDMWVSHHRPKAVSWHSTPHKYQCWDNPHTSVVDVYDDQSLFAWLFFLPVLALLLVFPQQSGALWCCLEDAPAYIADDWCSVKISDVEILGSVIAIGDCEIDLGPIG